MQAALAQYLPGAAWRRLRGLGTTLESVRVKYAMTCTPFTTDPDATVNEAAALMLDKRVGSLPVLADGRLVGIVTDRDAVRALATPTPPRARGTPASPARRRRRPRSTS
jgi:CBS domain-containing protein